LRCSSYSTCSPTIDNRTRSAYSQDPSWRA
jgi:hypothetical protein